MWTKIIIEDVTRAAAATLWADISRFRCNLSSDHENEHYIIVYFDGDIKDGLAVIERCLAAGISLKIEARRQD